MRLALIVLLPFLAAGLPPLAERYGGRTAGALAAMAPAAAGLALLLVLAGPVLSRHEALVVGWDWVPAFGLTLSFRLDGLSFLFALLILAIGLLIFLYSRGYLEEEDPLGRFLGLLLVFMGGMLGIVLSENLLLVALFWEITSLSSFLLIGFHGERDAEARRAALMALTVTGTGGLALLGGVLLLGHIVGSFELSAVLAARREAIQAHPLFPPALALIVFAAFTKSAQLPLHFWLPAAMVAPTPVSAYLHSAAMVKAGVFLLARLWPALAGNDLWFLLVGGVGLATFVAAAWIALFQTDIKGLLAYSTVSHLGMMVMLFGWGTEMAAVVAVVHLLNHAAFKAALFMVAGIVDHETGTRDIRRLGGLWRAMPVTSALALLAAAAMAGFPPLNGYVSKEMMLDESLQVERLGPGEWVLPALATLGALFSAAYGAYFAHAVFLRPRPPEAMPEEAPHEPHRRSLRLPVELLAPLCLALGVAPAALAGPLVEAAARSVVQGPLPEYHLSLWHGFNLPLLLSALALGGGVLAYYAVRGPVLRLSRRVAVPAAAAAFEGAYNRAVIAAHRGIHVLHNGSQQRYLTIQMATIAAVGLAGAWGAALAAGMRPMLPVTAIGLAGWFMLLMGVLGTVLLHRRRLTALVLISVVGLMVSLTFVHFSAPDLALTQLSVEIITTVLMLLALHLLPQRSRPRESRLWRARDAVLGVAVGAGAGVLAWAVMTRKFEPAVSRYLAAHADEAGGRNLVNLVLTDFRAFDTMGETGVLMIAALGAYALVHGLLDWLGDRRPRGSMPMARRSWDRYPPVLAVTARLLLPPALVVAVFLFLRGHDHPGGGFVAGIVTATAIIIQYMAQGVGWTQQRTEVSYRAVVACAVLVSVLTGVGSFAFGEPFMTHTVLHFDWPLVGRFEVSTALLFDLGIYLGVAGASLLVLVNIGRIETRARVDDDRAERRQRTG